MMVEILVGLSDVTLVGKLEYPEYSLAALPKRDKKSSTRPYNDTNPSGQVQVTGVGVVIGRVLNAFFYHSTTPNITGKLCGSIRLTFNGFCNR